MSMALRYENRKADIKHDDWVDALFSNARNTFIRRREMCHGISESTGSVFMSNSASPRDNEEECKTLPPSPERDEEVCLEDDVAPNQPSVLPVVHTATANVPYPRQRQVESEAKLLHYSVAASVAPNDSICTEPHSLRRLKEAQKQLQVVRSQVLDIEELRARIVALEDKLLLTHAPNVEDLRVRLAALEDRVAQNQSLDIEDLCVRLAKLETNSTQNILLVSQRLQRLEMQMPQNSFLEMTPEVTNREVTTRPTPDGKDSSTAPRALLATVNANAELGSYTIRSSPAQTPLQTMHAQVVSSSPAAEVMNLSAQAVIVPRLADLCQWVKQEADSHLSTILSMANAQLAGKEEKLCCRVEVASARMPLGSNPLDVRYSVGANDVANKSGGELALSAREKHPLMPENFPCVAIHDLPTYSSNSQTTTFTPLRVSGVAVADALRTGAIRSASNDISKDSPTLLVTPVTPSSARGASPSRSVSQAPCLFVEGAAQQMSRPPVVPPRVAELSSAGRQGNLMISPLGHSLRQHFPREGPSAQLRASSADPRLYSGGSGTVTIGSSSVEPLRAIDVELRLRGLEARRQSLRSRGIIGSR